MIVVIIILQDAGYSYTLQHIKQVDASDSSVGGIGLKFKVYRNGEYEKPSIVYFNTRQASRGIKDSKLVFERVSCICAYNICYSVYRLLVSASAVAVR